MRRFTQLLPICGSILIALLCLLLFALKAKWPGLKLNLDPKNVAELLGPITLAAAFIERAVEVVISPWRDLGADRLAHKADRAKKHVALTSLAATAANTVATAAMGDPVVPQADQMAASVVANQSTQAASQAATDASAATEAITEYRGLTKQYAYALSLLLGVVVAYSGVRGLEGLCVEGALKAVTGGQKLMFEVVDVILSGAVLAGGASGIHPIVNLVTTFAQVTSDKVKQPTTT